MQGNTRLVRNLVTTILSVLIIGLTGAAIAAENPSDRLADAVYFNGKIATFDKTASFVSAVAVKNGNILQVGSDDAIKKLADPSTKLIDLGGRTVVPGLIDAHTHPMEAMMMRDTWVDARFPKTSSVKEALEHITEWAKKTPKGEWIFVACVSASENKFSEKRLPNKAELDQAAPDNPVMLSNGTHMGVANTAALKSLGITKGMTKLPHGGSVILDKDGYPTGVLTDSMADVPFTPAVSQLVKYYSKDIQEFWNQQGFTSLLAITPAQALPVLQKIAGERTKPTLRFTASVWSAANGSDIPEDLAGYKMPKTADPAWYRLGGIKAWIDGENDCRTGFMYERYEGQFDTDPPGNKGQLVTGAAELNRFVEIAGKNGVMAMLHGSGDAAVDLGLTAYESQIQAGATGSIMRIEHFGMFQLSEGQLNRARKMIGNNFKISVQPVWLLDLVKADYENMGAERTRTGFAFRKLVDAGLRPAGGTDVTGIYLDNVNPFLHIYASVTRESDKGIFMPEEALTVTEALSMWTIWAAESMGEAAVKGSIEPGKFADMTVLSGDIFTMPKKNIKDIKAAMTIVGGQIVYKAKW